MPDTVLSALCVLTHWILSTHDEVSAIVTSNLEVGKLTYWESNPGSLAPLVSTVCHPSTARRHGDEMGVDKLHRAAQRVHIDLPSSLGPHGKLPFGSIKYAEINLNKQTNKQIRPPS